MRRRPDEINRPDIELIAEVKSHELRFEKVPDTEVRFPGYLEGESESGTERENLPEQVEEDVTYRDARIRLRSAGQLQVPERGDLGRRSNE